VNIHQWYPQDSHCGQLTLIMIIHANSFMIFFFNFSEITMKTALNLNIKNRYTNTIKYHFASETLVRWMWWINKSKLIVLENKWKKNTWKKDDDFFPIFYQWYFFGCITRSKKGSQQKCYAEAIGEKKLFFFSEIT